MLKLESILDNMLEGFTLLDADAKILQFNKAALTILGLTKEQIVGKTSLDTQWRAVLEDGSQCPVEMHPSVIALKTGLVQEKVTVGVHQSNGELRWLLVNAVPLFEAGVEKPANVICTFQDITEQKKLEKKLVEEFKPTVESEEHFRTLFECSPNPILFFGESGILDCNLAAVKILGGKNKAELLQQHPAEFSPEFQPDGRSSREKYVEMNRQAKENGFHRFDWRHKKIDSTEFTVEVTLAPTSLRDKPGLLVVWNDITELKEAAEKSFHSAKMATLGEMAGGVAHEINNPLAIIQGRTDLLIQSIERNKSFDEKWAMQSLKKITETCDRIAKIIKGMKTFSRNAERDPFDKVLIRNVIDDTLSVCGEKFKIHEVKLILDPIPEFYFNGRATQLSQILLNLLNNAYDAINGMNDKWIKISVYKKNETHFNIAVTDAGTGIPADIVNKLMQPFFTTKEVGKGTGLGLSISKGIVEEHKGKLFVDRSCVNTSFIVELPFYQELDKKVAA